MIRLLIEDDYVSLSAGRNAGPFHWAMRLVHCISRLYEDTHLDVLLKIIGKEYRYTDGKMAWVKYPTDPNQAFREFQEQQMAFYVEMSKGCTRSVGSSGHVLDSTQVNVCALSAVHVVLLINSY